MVAAFGVLALVAIVWRPRWPSPAVDLSRAVGPSSVRSIGWVGSMAL